MDPLIEKLASLAHDTWVEWERYRMAPARTREEHERWPQIVATPYADLSEKEKESDRAIARRYLELLRPDLSTREPPLHPPRHRLPDERRGVTRHTEVSWYERNQQGQPTVRRESNLYLTANFYEDGSLAELFACIDKAGATISVLVDAWCTALSIAVQYGIPARVFTSKFRGLGTGDSSAAPFMTNDPAIPQCKSPVDYIARWLELQLPPEENDG